MTAVAPVRRRSFAWTAMAAVLVAPSIWLLATLPPLWRDIDAYIQTTAGPGPSTILMHGPLYCFLARLPLYLGHLWENAGSEAIRSLPEFLLAPSLSDSGVILLIFLQHAALLGAHLYFVAAVSASVLVRVIVTVALALNPLAYAFAHSVGSEASSAIGMIAVAAAGVPIVRNAAPVLPRNWFIFGGLVTLMMLTRQVHGVLTLLLPLAFLIALGCQWLRRFLQRASTAATNHQSAKLLFRRCCVAVAVGAACVVFSNVCVRLISAAADMPYRSRIGFTFMWRLKFLQNLSPHERSEIARRVATRARSPEAGRFIDAIGEAYAHPEPFDISGFVRQERATLFPSDNRGITARMDGVLNELPLAFARGAPSALWRAAATDFAGARQMTIADLTEFLFWSTAFYVGREDKMPQLSGLATFRDGNAEAIVARGKQARYLRLWSGVSLNWWCAAWLLAFGALVALGTVGRIDVVASCSYATALMVAALLILVAHCFLTELLPRYVLPTFQLLCLSLLVLVSRIVEIGATQPVSAQP